MVGDEKFFSRAIDVGWFVARAIGAISQVPTAPHMQNDQYMTEGFLSRSFTDFQ